MAAPPEPSAWRPSGVVTLLTDFGLVDPYVGIMEGVLWRDAPGLRAVVGLTHGVPAQDVRRAAFFLRHSWGWFPPGTVHLAVVDPGVGSARAILAATSGGHAFVAPDNGLLEPVLAARPDARAFEVEVERLGLARGSRTFHGRDRFAPLAARIAGGEDPAGLGPERPSSGTPGGAPVLPEPVRSGGVVRGEVLFADRFGNLVTNVSPGTLGREASTVGERVSVRVAGREARVVGTYAEARDGELVCLLDSYGLYELAVPGASAAERLGSAAGTVVEFQERTS